MVNIKRMCGKCRLQPMEIVYATVMTIICFCGLGMFSENHTSRIEVPSNSGLQVPLMLLKCLAVTS